MTVTVFRGTSSIQAGAAKIPAAVAYSRDNDASRDFLLLPFSFLCSMACLFGSHICGQGAQRIRLACVRMRS